MSASEHPRLILHNFVSPAECKEFEFIHKSCCTVGYRPNVFSTTLSHLIATNSPHLIIPFVSIRERLKEKVEETFGCQFELFIEFTGLISWCQGASIGWHSDDNRPYLKQRDFAAVCYLNSYEKDFKGGLFHFQSGEPATVVPVAGDVIIYTADDRNIHSVDEVTGGERLTLALWFSRDSSHNEDSKLLSRLSQCSLHGFCLPLPASTSMYWFCPHQDDCNQEIGFDICIARLHLLGFNVYSLQGKGHSVDASEQLVGPLQIAKGRNSLTRKFANILHALQVVQFYHWKISELRTSNIKNEAVNEVEAMSQPQLETINVLKSVLLPDENIVTTVFGYSCKEDSLELKDLSLAITSWEEYSFADIIFWKNKKESGTILAVFTLIWFLFEVVEYPFITFICQILLISIFVFLIWSYIGSSQLIQRKPPSINDLRISESTWRFLFTKINWFIINLYDISSGKDFKLLFLAVVSLWILSIVGNYFSSLTLLYIIFVALETIPMLYELYEEEISYAASKSGRNMKKVLNNFNSKVINKIPKAQAKNKRHM